MEDKPSQGQRFSHVYLARGEPANDSLRMRRRLLALFFELEVYKLEAASALQKELGVGLPYAVAGYDWRSFFEKGDLRDILDSITVVFRLLSSHSRQRTIQWHSDTARILAEENVRYRLDPQGGVHFFVDQEFESNRAASISALGTARYANSRQLFEDAHRAFDSTPPDGKLAVRTVFAACEGLFRLMFPKAGVLGVDEISKHLRPTIDRCYERDRVAQAAANKMATGLREWVAAAHAYRHEPGSQEPAQPPPELAILLVSQGGSFLRWLAEVDGMEQSL